MTLARLLPVIAALALFACQSDTDKAKTHLSRGESLLKEEKFDEAVIEFKNATKLDPNNGASHYGLAKAHLGKKDARSAYWELEETVRLDPANVQARIDHGEFLLLGRNEELEKAVGSGELVINAEPKRWEGYALKGRALAGLGRHEEAGIAFAKGAEVAPDQPAVVLLWANHLRGAGKLPEAEAQYKKLAEIAPGFGTSAALGGFYAGVAGREADAEAAYRQALANAKNEELVMATTVMSQFLGSQNRAAEAEQVIKDAIAKAPGNTELIYALAGFYAQQGRAADADAMVEQATQAAPDQAEPWLVLSAHRGKQGDLNGALEAAEKAIGVEPDNDLAKLRRAEVLVDIGARKSDSAVLAQANAVVDAILAKNENHPEANFVKGKLELARNNLPAALSALRRTIERRPEMAQAYFLAGSAKFLQGDRAGARADAQEAIARAPGFREAMVLLARAHAALGDHALAVEAGNRALALGAGSELRIVIAQSLVQQGQIPEALKELEAIPEAERGLDANFAFGRVYLFQGSQLDAKSRRDGREVTDPSRQAEAVASFARARAHLEAAAKLAPNHPEVLASLFVLDQREGRVDQSLERVNAAAAAAPKDASLARLAGDIAARTGKLDAAEASYRRAIEIDPNQLESYGRLAGLYNATGRGAQVIKTYEDALARNPKSGELHLVLGILKEAQGGKQIDAAIAHYEEAIKLNGELAAAKNNLAYWLAERGQDLDRALDLAQEAKATLAKNPRTNPASADTLGWVFYKKNLPEAAVNYLREAVGGFDPTIPSDAQTRPLVRHHLALALDALGDKAEAKNEWTLALSEYTALPKPQGAAEPSWVNDARAGLAALGGA
jgi:tetratricopeptide (TPR) repeat protein